MLPARCAEPNSAGSRSIQDLRSAPLQGENSIEGHRVDAGQGLLERRPLLAIQDRVIVEVGGSFGLVGSNYLNERFLAHGLQRVVRAALFAHGGDRLLAQRFAAERAGTVSRVDQSFIRLRQQLGVQRIEEHAAELRGRPARRRAQIGPAYVADEQRVAGEHRMRLGAFGVQVVYQNGDRLRRVARRLQSLQAHAPEFESVAVVQRGEPVGRFGGRAEIDGRAAAVAQFQVAGDEIGVQMREEHVLDLQAVLGGKGDVLVSVALRVDHAAVPVASSPMMYEACARHGR